MSTAERTRGPGVAEAEAVAARVTDPEMPMLTLFDLGVLREVVVEAHPAGTAGTVVTVALTPTYSGCPAMATMRDDLVRALTEAGFDEVRVQVRLSPPWTSDWITPRGRAALREHRISPPGAVEARPAGPVPLRLGATRRELACPRCGSDGPADLGVRPDRLHRALPLHRVRRAVRARQGDSR